MVIFQFFKITAACHLGFVWTMREEYFVVSITVQNLVVIMHSFDNMKISIFGMFGLKAPIYAPKLKIYRHLTLKMRSNINKTSKKHILHESRSFKPSKVKIHRPV